MVIEGQLPLSAEVFRILQLNQILTSPHYCICVTWDVKHQNKQINLIQILHQISHLHISISVYYTDISQLTKDQTLDTHESLKPVWLIS